MTEVSRSDRVIELNTQGGRGLSAADIIRRDLALPQEATDIEAIYALTGQGRLINLFRTGASTDNAVVADPEHSVSMPVLSAADLYQVHMVGSNTVNNPTLNAGGLGAKPIRNSGGDPVAVPAWVDNTHLILKYDVGNDEFRIIVRGQSAADVNVRVSEYLTVVQTNTSAENKGNRWVVAPPAGVVASTADLTTLAFVVAYEQGEGGLLMDASAVFAGAELWQVLWPSGNQVTPGELPVGTLVEIKYASTGPLIGRGVITSPPEPGSGGEVSAYDARRAFYTARNIQLAAIG